ncbi:MAG: ATP-dependent Clp protease ATP-binding subunit [Chitinophagaceae bacterium]|nr:ATP-dependent Clp protease ATP-binding subunit [Chitinophagaceae bacterium]
MEARFSNKVKEIIMSSKEEAIRIHHDYIAPEHIVLGIIRYKECAAMDILEQLYTPTNDIKEYIELRIKNNESPNESKQNNPQETKKNISIPLTKETEAIMKKTYLEARMQKSDIVESEHLLLAILRDQETFICKVLNKFKITYDAVKDILYNKSTDNKNMYSLFNPESDEESDEFNDQHEKEDVYNQRNYGNNTKASSETKSKTPALDVFSRDLTKLAEENKLDIIVGRDTEIERVVQILSRRKKNNPILIGEPGVGKTAIAEGLAIKIIQKKVSRILYNKRVVSLDITSVVAGTKYRGQFEERMKAIMAELGKSKDIILFIDELHTMVGAGNAVGTLDASNMLKPALARGEIQCIGSTTLDEYKKYIEVDGALARRFQTVIIEEPSILETIQILNNIKDKYETHHNVEYTEGAINQSVKLSAAYITNRFLPDKAIDILDEVGARVHIKHIYVPKEVTDIETKLEGVKRKKNEALKEQKYENAAQFRDREKELNQKLENAKQEWHKKNKDTKHIVQEEDVADVVASITGIPVKKINQNERKKLMSMQKDIQEKIIGQDEAVQKVVKAIQRNRVGLKDPKKPIASFIFLGPTGVGKTELAKVLTQYLFEKNEALIRIDMSEYMETIAVTRLIGAPPGYVGYEEGGQLTEKVRRKPYSVILLDEIEKANPAIFNILLQILDDGSITDGMGRKINFRNTIIIMTSNLGMRNMNDFGAGIGFASQTKQENKYEIMKSIVETSLKKTFNPEFLNRLDDIIIFKSLEKQDLYKIIDNIIKNVFERITNIGYTVKLTEEAKNFIIEKGYDPQYGARPLYRTIQKYIEDPISDIILDNESFPEENPQLIKDQITILIDCKDENITINTTSKKIIYSEEEILNP